MQAFHLRFAFAAAVFGVSMAASTNLPIIDAMGSLHRSALTNEMSQKGVIAVINASPVLSKKLAGTPSQKEVSVQTLGEECTIISSPGALVVPTTSRGSAGMVASGFGCATASVGAGVVVVDGFTSRDIALEDEATGGEVGVPEEWKDSRLGRSLSAVFAAHASADNLTQRRTKKVALVLGVQADVTSLQQQQAVMRTVEDLYKEVMETKRLIRGDDGTSDEYVFGLEDVYDVMLVELRTEDDVSKMMAMASQVAAERTPTSTPLSALVADTYSAASRPASLLHHVITLPRAVVRDRMLCHQAFVENWRHVQWRYLTPWKQRVFGRNLCVDKFGAQATNLYKNTLQRFDFITCSVAGSSPSAASYRLLQRAKLQAAMTKGISELVARQLEIAEADAVKQLEKRLLQLRKADALAKLKTPKATSDAATAAEERMASEYNDKAAAVRAAAFSFDTKANDLEVPPLKLFKGGNDVSNRLNEVLGKLDSSPAAQLQDLKIMTKRTSREAPITKKKKATEPSIDIGMSLVAMFRPDGYGNLQGYAGYNLGPHGVTVGVQNDADSPEVMNQFGGVRPPFLRVQPKLNVDVEL